MKIDENKDEEKKVYNGEQVAIILWIPKNTYKIKCEVEFIDDSRNIRSAVMNMLPDEAHEARNDYLLLDPYDDAFATYELTEKGLEYAKQLEKKRGNNYDD